MILFISCCKTLKTDPSGEGYICTCATWIRPFLKNVHPHDWFMPAIAQPENAITIGNWGFIWKYKYILENLKIMLLEIKSSWRL